MAKIMSVHVKKCQLRNKPTFLGKVVSKLSYADQVTVEQEDNSWVKVFHPKNKDGWVHVSALSEKEIILNPNSDDIQAAASSDEIALAGKGFNKEVEKKFKENNWNIDFAWVDRMEKMTVSQNDIQSFISKGDLKVGGSKS